MAKKEFSKFFIASLKRTAQNVSPLIRRKQKIQSEMDTLAFELEEIQTELDSYEAPFKASTGYSVEDLVERVVEVTDKVDKDGKPVKITKWVLKYPDTVVPPTEPEEANVPVDTENNMSETAENLNLKEEEDVPPVFEEPLTIE